jgi:CheY-like chemotaxis protein
MSSSKLLNILLAEDNRGDVLLVRQALDEHHIRHKLYVVQDGAEAIRFIEQMGQPDSAPCPDLMLLDLNLPKAEGQQVLAEFRKHPACAHTPVIVVSSSDAPRDRARIGALGVTRYFRKPSELDEFMKLGGVVRDVVNEAAKEKSAASSSTFGFTD